MQDADAPKKMFDRTANLNGAQIISYKVSSDDKWCTLVGIAPGAPERWVCSFFLGIFCSVSLNVGREGAFVKQERSHARRRMRRHRFLELPIFVRKIQVPQNFTEYVSYGYLFASSSQNVDFHPAGLVCKLETRLACHSCCP